MIAGAGAAGTVGADVGVDGILGFGATAGRSQLLNIKAARMDEYDVKEF